MPGMIGEPPMPLRRRTLLASALFAALAARAEGFPTGPVRIITPFPPGQSMDVLPRILADRLSARWPQRVIMENKPGGVGTIGMEAVVRSAPDGHTLGIGSPSTLAVNPTLLPNAPYDAARDLAPVARLFDVAIGIVVNPAVPVRDMAGLVAWLKANPGTQYGSAGPATMPNLIAELLAMRLGVTIGHVPYKGSAPMLADLVAGHLPLAVDTMASAGPLAREGRLRLLAVTTGRRLASFPDTPTVAETVLPGFDASSWGGLVAPAATPLPLREWIAGEFAAVLREEAVATRFGELGATPAPLGPVAFGGFIAQETATWGEVIKAAGIQLGS
jgi:tripartite-type tricarboxylate transporter receptor subunit TctC